MSSATETEQTNWVEELLQMSQEELAMLDQKLVVGIQIIKHALAGDKSKAIEIYSENFDKDLKGHLRVLLEGLRSELNITDYLREMPEHDRKSLKNQNLAKAIEAYQLTMGKQEQKAEQLILEAADPQISYYCELLLEGKYPTRMRDLVELSEQDLAAIYNISPITLKAVSIVKQWLNYEKEAVLERCDDLITLCAVRDTLSDTVPDSVAEFNELTAAKWKIYLSDASQLAAVWVEGEENVVLQACNNPDLAPSLLSLLQQAVTSILQTKDPKSAEKFTRLLNKNSDEVE
jgi:hypothetical protein